MSRCIAFDVGDEVWFDEKYKGIIDRIVIEEDSIRYHLKTEEAYATPAVWADMVAHTSKEFKVLCLNKRIDDLKVTLEKTKKEMESAYLDLAELEKEEEK